MTRDRLNIFLKDFSKLCHNHGLYIEGNNLRVEDPESVIIGIEMEYDNESSEYTATFDDQGSRFR